MKRIAITPEDEYQHPPQENPLWWENYYFNGYDPVKKIGITTYVGIKPVLGVREEIIIVYAGDPLLFRNEKELEKNALTSGSLQMEPVELLKKWRIYMKDSFQKTKDSPLSDSEEVEFDLLFESDIPPFGYSTNRGTRYEQPGILRGRIFIGGNTVGFHGRGIRDHSWEIRFVPSWGEWYGLMGCLPFGFVTCAYMDIKGSKLCQGWVRTDTYSEIQGIQVDPVFSGDILKECRITMDTVETTLEIDSHVISFVSLSMGEEQGRSDVRETLVHLDENGHGFLWYGKQH